MTEAAAGVLLAIGRADVDFVRLVRF